MKQLGSVFLLAAAAALGLAALEATPAYAGDIYQSYNVQTSYDLRHIITYDDYGDGDGFTNSYQLPAPGGVLSDSFPKSSAHPPLATYLMGTSALGDGDPLSDTHLVIAFNVSYADSLIAGGTDFGSTFGYDENAIIDALVLLDTADLDADDPGYADQQAAKSAAVSLIFDFSENLSSLGALADANGGAFELVGFSAPQLVGSGTALLTASSVPEPFAWAMMLGGFGMVGMSLRYRRSKLSISYR